MFFFNPLYLLAPPALILISLPLIGFAILTSTVAFATLLIRVSVVYFELGLALLRSALFTEMTKPAPRVHTQQPTQMPRRRRSSVISISSVQDFRNPGPVKSESFASLLGAGAQGATRDFEGVGGWRESENPAEEALWIGMNSRLELPAAAPERQRRHQRSLTGGSQRFTGVYSPEAMRMSPVQSRARTPSVTDTQFTANGEEYFGLEPHARWSNESLAGKGLRSNARRKSVAGEEEKRKGGPAQIVDKRKNSSGSSASSTSSVKPVRIGAKQTSYG